ncbi:MAG: hypothetical protein EXR66_03265 [Dehalococcoidia bacterium]|nr:hypothetical protein [Dehalococcoidia bacterium]
MVSRRRFALAALVAVVSGLASLIPIGTSSALRAEACAFLRSPYAYEAEQSRLTYLATIDAASINQLFPTHPFFGLPAVEAGGRNNRTPGAARIPTTLLKSIAWVESTITMAQRSVVFESTGPALVSFDCGHGIMQVTTGMTVPLGSAERPSVNQTAIATHYAFNIARGAGILAEKWNEAPERRAVAGTDTNSDPTIIENWYFATWAYNGFTGPGANYSNHPLDPSFGSFPRATYQCEGSQSRARYPYQELVIGCMSSPPTRNNTLLWTPLAASLPNTTLPQWFAPLQLSNFVFPYSGMDIPTPQPAHFEAAPPLRPEILAKVLGAPSLGVSGNRVTVSVKGRPEDARATVQIQNAGTGLLVWSAVSDDRWMVVDPPAGVALGSDLSCRQECARAATITVSVNPTLLNSATAVGTLRIGSPNGGADRVIRVEVDASFAVGAPGVSRSD